MVLWKVLEVGNKDCRKMDQIRWICVFFWDRLVFRGCGGYISLKIELASAHMAKKVGD